MTAHSQPAGPDGLADPAKARVDRDRHIALLFLEKGESRKAVKEILQETGVARRTAYRAIERELEWAREHKKEKGPKG